MAQVLIIVSSQCSFCIFCVMTLRVGGIGACSLVGHSHDNEDRFIHMDEREVWRITTGRQADTSPSSASRPVAFFAVYDGHGGELTVEQVSKTLHARILTPTNHPLLFPPSSSSSTTTSSQEAEKEYEVFQVFAVLFTRAFFRISDAILRGFRETEEEVLARNLQQEDISGSCAVTVLMAGDRLYVANLGDSRAIIGRKAVKTSFIGRITLSKASSVGDIETREKEKGVTFRCECIPLLNDGGDDDDHHMAGRANGATSSRRSPRTRSNTRPSLSREISRLCRLTRSSASSPLAVGFGEAEVCPLFTKA